MATSEPAGVREPRRRLRPLADTMGTDIIQLADLIQCYQSGFVHAGKGTGSILIHLKNNIGLRGTRGVV